MTFDKFVFKLDQDRLINFIIELLDAPEDWRYKIKDCEIVLQIEADTQAVQSKILERLTVAERLYTILGWRIYHKNSPT